jgi:SAM-dependent methyltransferase
VRLFTEAADTLFKENVSYRKMSDTQPKGSKYGMGQDKKLLDSFSQRDVDDSAAYLKGYIQSHMKILDVGCGPGSITLDFARRVPQGHVTGLDTEAASTALDRARAQAKANGISNVDFVTGDALALPFPDDTFDIAHAHQVLIHVADPVQIIREMRRVTKPGGFVACRETDTRSQVMQPHIPDADAWVKLFWRMAEENGTNIRAGFYLLGWAREAGFDRGRIRFSTSTWTYATPEERRMFANTALAMLTSSAYTESAVKKGYATNDDLTRMARGWEDWVEDEDAFWACMQGEILCQV